jgi:hypothetical protein
VIKILLNLYDGLRLSFGVLIVNGLPWLWGSILGRLRVTLRFGNIDRSWLFKVILNIDLWSFTRILTIRLFIDVDEIIEDISII